MKKYWALIKDLQTGLLVVTAAAGYSSACCLNFGAGSLLGMAASLFLAVAGCTILNMVYDRDLDARMERTRRRPLPAGTIRPAAALALGLLLALGGVGWAFAIDGLFGLLVLAGLLCDALIYTVWLKRRSPWAILFGGLAGGMPVLAGRSLALGRVDEVGLLLALGVLLWIPTHMLSFQIKHAGDYAAAGIPTVPAACGLGPTRALIAASTVLSVAAILAAGWLIRLGASHLAGLAALGLLLLGLVSASILHPGRRLNLALYKGASVYMLAAMLTIIAGGL